MFSFALNSIVDLTDVVVYSVKVKTISRTYPPNVRCVRSTRELQQVCLEVVLSRLYYLKWKFTIFPNSMFCRVQSAESNGEGPRFVQGAVHD